MGPYGPVNFYLCSTGYESCFQDLNVIDYKTVCSIVDWEVAVCGYTCDFVEVISLLFR